MNYLGNELVYIEDERVNRSPDRVDRYTRTVKKCGKKVCRPDRFVSGRRNFT
jgi:hypothetical protein